MEHQYEVILCQLNAMQVNVTVEHPSVRPSVLSITAVMAVGGFAAERRHRQQISCCSSKCRHSVVLKATLIGSTQIVSGFVSSNKCY